MKTQKGKVTDETQIRQLTDDWAEAVRAKDVNALMANYAPDVLSFDLVAPLQHTGAATARKQAEQWLATYQGPIGCEMRDLSITASDEVAFSHCLNHITGTRTNGEKVDMWLRATICYRKIDGKWLVTHEHISVPIDMQTGKGALDLKP